ncbi:MAG: hypothetical protein ABGW78_01760, partial [Pirellulales bacterium]
YSYSVLRHIMAADMLCAGGSSKKRHKKLRRIEPHTHDTIEGDSQAGTGAARKPRTLVPHSNCNRIA